jgi:hypothetical protein
MDGYVAELVGIIRGVVADGHVSSEEATHLVEWTRNHPELAERWPADMLARRLENIFRDGRVDARDRRLLESILGQLAENRGSLARLATDLPLDRPPPPVRFPGHTFVFAGEFSYGPRHACEREVEDLGGRCDRTVTRRTDFLVIGALAGEDWTQSGFGREVDDVVRLRHRGEEVAILSEDRWAAALP